MARNDGSDDAAARWAVRLGEGALDDVQQAELDSWLRGDAVRAGMLLRAQAALHYLDRGLALGEIAPPRRTLIGRRGFLAGGAGVAASIAGGIYVADRPQTVDTGIGELRRLPLSDGSLATLNTRTRVQISMVRRQRTVRLDEGEAWFRVAREKRRPFVVEAGDVRVRAIGTAFSVRRRDLGADVLVTEGTVETWVMGREDKKRRITSGSRGFVPEIRAEIEVATAPQDIERALAWRGGELVLNGETLAYAAAELNRYNVRQIVVDDDRLRNEQLIGFFRTSEPENFARAVAGMTGARVVTENETIRIESPTA
jgi:transmembrane sensor